MRHPDRPCRRTRLRLLALAAVAALVAIAGWACDADLARDLVVRLDTRDAEELQRLTDRLLKFDRDDLIPALRGGLRSPAWRARYASAQLLGSTGDAGEALPDLVQALDDSVDAVVAAAAEALGRLRARRAVADLVACLDGRQDIVVIRAAEALGRIGDPAALPALCRRSRTGTLRARAVVVAALGACVSDSVAPAWSDSARRLTFAALHDDTPELRLAGIESLRGFEYRGAVDTLLAALHDPAPEVQHVVVQALGEVTGADHPAWAGQAANMARLVAALDSAAAHSGNVAVRARAVEAHQEIDRAERRRRALATP